MDKELEIKLRENFETALNTFDFAKVYGVMKFLDWSWWNTDITPNQSQMINAVTELFESALIYIRDSTSSTIGSGGFYIEIYKFGKVRIWFSVTNSESDDIE